MTVVRGQYPAFVPGESKSALLQKRSLTVNGRHAAAGRCDRVFGAFSAVIGHRWQLSPDKRLGKILK
jgi:hypothetical protein